MDQHKLSEAIRKVASATEAVFHNAVHLTNAYELDDRDLPRLCIGAACRSVEVMLDQYSRALDGTMPLSKEQKAGLRAQIQDAAADLHLALQQAQRTVATLVQNADAVSVYDENPSDPETRH